MCADSAPSNTPAGNALSALFVIVMVPTPLRSAKSPAFSAVSPKSSSAKFPIAARWVSVTFEQSVTAASRFCANTTSLSRTCGVRSHTPPVSAGVEPSTLCAASAATASWPSIAAAP